MNIDELTLGQIKQIQSLCGSSKASDKSVYDDLIGNAIFVRTVTMHDTGVLMRVTEKELVLTDCAWIADSGRFHKALAKGELNEVEPYPDGEVIINRDSLLDICAWDFALPRVAK